VALKNLIQACLAPNNSHSHEPESVRDFAFTGNNPTVDLTAKGRSGPPKTADGEREQAAQSPVFQKGQCGVKGKGVQGTEVRMQDKAESKQHGNVTSAQGRHSRNVALCCGPPYRAD
jgi:hypothetical protein